MERTAIESERSQGAQSSLERGHEASAARAQLLSRSLAMPAACRQPRPAHRSHIRFLAALTAAVAFAAVLAGPASSSQLIDRNAQNVRLAVNKKGEALLTYTVGGRVRHVLVWGAINARFPNPTIHQVMFSKDYAGGWG